MFDIRTTEMGNPEVERELRWESPVHRASHDFRDRRGNVVVRAGQAYREVVWDCRLEWGGKFNEMEDVFGEWETTPPWLERGKVVLEEEAA